MFPTACVADPDGQSGLVSAEGLGNVRKYAIVPYLFGGVTADAITQVILFVVVYGLYEISIFLIASCGNKA